MGCTDVNKNLNLDVLFLIFDSNKKNTLDYKYNINNINIESDMVAGDKAGEMMRDTRSAMATAETSVEKVCVPI